MIKWSVKKFQELTLDELYSIWNLREAVFVVEQHCYYLDADGVDKEAFHVMAYANDQLVAYARIYSTEDKNSIHFGRVCTHKEYRKNGLGKQLIAYVMEYIKNHTNARVVKISAQSYLLKFYQSFGFKLASEMYLDAGIEHNDMQILIERNIS